MRLRPLPPPTPPFSEVGCLDSVLTENVIPPANLSASYSTAQSEWVPRARPSRFAIDALVSEGGGGGGAVGCCGDAVVDIVTSWSLFGGGLGPASEGHHTAAVEWALGHHPATCRPFTTNSRTHEDTPLSPSMDLISPSHS